MKLILQQRQRNPSTMILDPLSEDARLLSMVFVPGVINGTMVVDANAGYFEMDFEKRDGAFPTITFHPNQETKV